MHNRYFIGRNKEITAEIEAVIVGTKEQQRQPSKNGSINVKLHLDDVSDYPCLEDWEEMTHEQLADEFKKDEWNYNNLT